MKQILKWLETKFSRHSAAVEADEQHIAVGVAVVPGRVESHGPGKDIQMPNIYDSDDPYKQQQLKFWEDGLKLTTLDESSLDASESTGFDPYNSGSFETSKSRSRE